MNQYLKTIQDLLQQSSQLTEQDKEALLKALTDADKQWSITDFKLDRTEKVKKTTAILLEETIAELEQKRKAVEAQNRELEIESSLERVRARAMAMQKSDELKELITTVSAELGKLDIVLDRCFIVTYDIQTMGSTWWMSHPETPLESFGLFVKYHEHPPYLAHIEAWKERQQKWQYILEGEVKEIWDKFLFVETELSQLPGFVIAEMRAKKKIYLSSSFNNFGYLTLATNEPLSEEQFDIMLRFAKVFDLTYTRFNDLKQAEVQAREAQIELALERIRARTMAMQKSGELAETSLVLFQQFKDLGETSEQISIGIFNENIMELYSTLYGSQWKESAKVDLNEPVVMKKIHTAWREQEKVLVIDLVGKDLRKYNAYRKKLSNLDYREDRWVIHIAFFSKGALTFSTTEPRPQETIQLLERFAGVFDQTYTRFLDLQKAEAQAREAQIQLALERVRARTMAMQHSDELKDAAALLFQQVKTLGVPAYSCGYNIWEKNEKEFTSWMSTQDGSDFNAVSNIPLTEDANFIRFADSRQKGEPFFVLEMRGKRMQEHYEYLKTIPAFKAYFDYAVSMGFDLPETQIHHVSNFSQGNLLFITYEPVPEAHDIFKRFGKVFEQTYTRFLDLQKAEAQTREAQIQLSLERVRARAMAMHHSDELSEVLSVLFEQFDVLGISPLYTFLSFIDLEKNNFTYRIGRGGKRVIAQQVVNLDASDAWKDALERWKAANYDTVETIYVPKELVPEIFEVFREVYSALPEGAKVYPEDFPDGMYANLASSKFGHLGYDHFRPSTEEEKAILLRFNTEFIRFYQRFLDLQKAEAQAREAQIEASLERVRARTMAMHSSVDVSSATATMFHELEKLNIQNFRAGILNIRPDQTMEVWSVNTLEDGSIIRAIGDFDMKMHTLWRQLYKQWINKEEFFHFDMSGKDKEDYIRILDARRDYLPNGLQHLPDCTVQSYFFGEGAVWTYSLQPHSKDDKQVMKRFASVFSLTFRRYKDLQKAEAQAREAQIEAALERVRARAMAMHKSDDLKIAVATVFEELDRLNLGLIRCGIAILDKEQPRGDIWITIKSEQGNTIGVSGDEPLDIHPLLQGAYDAWLRHEDYSYVLENDDLLNYYRAITKTNFQRAISATFDTAKREQQQHYFNAVFQDGSLFAFLDTAFTDEAKTVMKRFANVFNLTYKRFLDLQKAEAQAREATIEAALERVRGKAMAMHNSNDLSVTASMVFTELRKLGINSIRCGVGLLSKETRKAQLYLATSSNDGGDSLSLIGWVDLSNHPVAEKIYESWLKNEDYFPVLSGEQLKSYYKNLLSGLSLPSVPDWEDGQKEYGTFLPFSVGSLNTWSEAPYNDTEIKILKRFATIIDLTFRRYLELQKSEANAREAVKQAALDRVRAEIASMRTVGDLDRITPLIWNELTILGIRFIRCGVFIMDESQQLIHTFLSNPEGKAIAAFHLPYNTPGRFPDLIDHWRNKKIYVSRWSEDDFLGIANTLLRQGAIATKKQYLDTLPKGGFYLHFLPFLQGLLYVGNTVQLGEEEIILIQHVADAFSTAYARYEDFNKLEAAKQQVDKTLVDLKQAQTQLVQSEKMASLGELTAGIAHEIQNPLNFVNNFSDVSNELLEEMKGELATGNTQQAIAIADDVRQNLEKILHHGKRADAIVKGMLQHSRTSSGQKEPTDINVLADEYLRLAYHGLRAKEKSFNAKFETDFDQSIGKINIIPQEIGRVVLNLINNAFYAVSEKKKTEGEAYEPTVTVSTRKYAASGNGGAASVEISVSDNGIGIPEGTGDKIFQPFFTTKPSGQGTGLGLSLAYDIITKGHGGDIKVKSIPGKGSEFIIHLPANATQ